MVPWLCSTELWWKCTAKWWILFSSCSWSKIKASQASWLFVLHHCDLRISEVRLLHPFFFKKNKQKKTDYISSSCRKPFLITRNLLRFSMPWQWKTDWKEVLTQKAIYGDFPSRPVDKASPSNAGGAGLIPGYRAKIPHASWPKNQNIKQKQYCNKFNKGFENGPHQKKKKKGYVCPYSLWAWW